MQYPFADETQGVHKSSSEASWPSCPPNCWWEDTLDYAMDPLKNWNEVTPGDGFTIAYLSSMGGEIFDCWWSDPGDNLIARKSFGDGARGAYATTTRCPQGTNPRNRFFIFLDTDTNWYHTPGDDDVNNTSSAIGVVVHELGHGIGFGDASAPDHFADPCDGNALGDWQTMCAGEPNNDTDNIWRLITIENHDKPRAF